MEGCEPYRLRIGHSQDQVKQRKNEVQSAGEPIVEGMERNGRQEEKESGQNRRQSGAGEEHAPVETEAQAEYAGLLYSGSRMKKLLIYRAIRKSIQRIGLAFSLSLRGINIKFFHYKYISF